MSFNPAYSFLNTLMNLLAGHIQFRKNRIGQKLTMEDGREFVIFREAVINPGKNRTHNPGAVFRVRFHLANMSPEKNKLFSLIPIPFIIGLPGFRSKMWMIDEKTGDFQGIYEWDSVQDAKNYANSFAMKFMTKRSVPGSASYKIFPRDEWMKLCVK